MSTQTDLIRNRPLLIRTSQYNAIARSTHDIFHENICLHLRRVWPEECSSLGSSLEDFVSNATRRARAYGIETEYDAGRFCDLTLLWGENFEDDERLVWAKDILESPGYDGRVKVDQLFAHTEQYLERQRQEFASRER